MGEKRPCGLRCIKVIDVLEATLLPPKLLTSISLSTLGLSGPHDSLEPNADEGTKLHIHLCMCSIVCHVHSLHSLQGGKMWLLSPQHHRQVL